MDMKYNRNMFNESYTNEDFIFFWGHTPDKRGMISACCLSQWWMCDFSENGKKFNCAEQYMMYNKAVTFGDSEYAEKIMKSSDQKQIKDYGRMVRNFDPEVWDSVKTDIVVKGNMLKFSQNPELKKYLTGTGYKILVEASPYDKLWGIGMQKGAKGCTVPAMWNGENLLGFALMEVRDMLAAGD